MKIELSDITELPEGLKTALESEGDKHALDLSKLMPAEDLTGLKTALVKERENAAAYSKFGKPDEIAAKIADLEEKAKGTGKGAEDAQAKLDAMKNDYETKLTGAQQRFQALVQQRTQSDLKAELAKAGVVPEGLDMLATFAAQRIQYHEDGTPKVLSPDGKPMIGSGPDHGATLSDLAAELAKSMPYLVKDAAKGGGGKPPNSNGGKPDAPNVTRAQWDQMSHVDRAAHSKSGGKVTD
jgi:hypothetical protein